MAEVDVGRKTGPALDVLEGLIKATYTRDRAAHLARVNLRREKLRILFRLAKDLRFLDPRRYEDSARWCVCLQRHWPTSVAVSSRRLAGRWESDLDAADETAALRRARSAGRKVVW